MQLVIAILLSAGLANVASAYGAALRSSPKGPVAKVVTMLTDVRDQIVAEGTEEAKTYNKFACFCKDAMADKTKAIADAETNKGTLEAAVNGASSRRDKEDIAMAQKDKEITTLEAEIKKMKQDRRADELTYAKSEVDLTRALQGLDRAIDALKAAKAAVSLAQLRGIAGTLRQAVNIAAVLSPGRAAERAAAALTQLDQVPSSIYDFQSDSVVKTLEGLRTEFLKKKTDLNDAESKALKAHEALLQTKEGDIKTNSDAYDSHQKNKAKEVQLIATAMRDLTVENAQLLDDQAYLTELSKRCNEKGVMWDKRSRARENELAAMTSVLKILQSADVQGSPPAAPKTMLQLESAATPVLVGVQGSTARLVEVSAVAKEPTALVQLDQARHQLHLRGGHSQPGDWRSAAAALLRADATTFRSALFLRLADQVSDDKDPFAKVKTLIQELIERLLKEAASEADHKGWCDKQVAAAEQTRDHSADAIMEVNERLEASEARREKLTEEVAALDQQLKTTQTELDNSTKLRNQEKADAKKAVDDAKKGQAAMVQAIDILSRYYKEAENNAAKSLLQQQSRQMRATGDKPGGGLDADIPDAGFSDDYAGAAGAADGIMGMLEVIKSDFERTIADTQQAEKEAEKAYLELQTTAGASLAEKTEAMKARKAALVDANKQDGDDRSSLTKHQKTLDGALAEMEALHKPCLDGGMSAEEKKLQRDQEMDALKQVLEILDKHGTN